MVFYTLQGIHLVTQVSCEREALEAQLVLERDERAAEVAAVAAAEQAAQRELQDMLRATAQRTASLDAEVGSEQRMCREYRARLLFTVESCQSAPVGLPPQSVDHSAHLVHTCTRKSSIYGSLISKSPACRTWVHWCQCMCPPRLQGW